MLPWLYLSALTSRSPQTSGNDAAVPDASSTFIPSDRPVGGLNAILRHRNSDSRQVSKDSFETVENSHGPGISNASSSRSLSQQESSHPATLPLSILIRIASYVLHWKPLDSSQSNSYPPPLFTSKFEDILASSAWLERSQAQQNVHDVIELMLVCGNWSDAAAATLYASPPFIRFNSFESFTRLLTAQDTFHDYPALVSEISLEGSAADGMEMGDLETALGLCPNLVSFKLISCPHVSSILLQFLADFSPNLQSLVLAGCPISDGYIPRLVEGCPQIRRLDISGTNITLKALDIIVTGLGLIEHLVLDEAKDEQLDSAMSKSIRSTATSPYDSSPANALIHMTPTSPHLDSVSLRKCNPLPSHLRLLSHRAPHVTVLSLASCQDLTDDAVAVIARCFPALIDLDLDWCSHITDVSLQSLAVHLGGHEKAELETNVTEGGYNMSASSTSRRRSVSTHHDGSFLFSPPSERTRRSTIRSESASRSGASDALGKHPQQRWVSPLRILGLSGTNVTQQGVRHLARTCGALVQVRLEECSRIPPGSIIANIAIDMWVRRHEATDGSTQGTAGQGRVRSRESSVSRVNGDYVSPAKSRLPVPTGRRRSSVVPAASPERTGVALVPFKTATAAGERPPLGWCRLEGRATMKRVAALED
ncbi:hypothetical protein DFJ73DRAFT_851757 [Zopfochytrium polystomum]|nr:hypothetical protein DFJ73DRAFT_851757 [Zopfochytrium polystomum]